MCREMTLLNDFTNPPLNQNNLVLLNHYLVNRKIAVMQ
jgi:hypothetical protein